MLRLLADENFNGEILRGLWQRVPNLDVLRAQDQGLTGSPDAALLQWAAANDRILLTHDRRTMPREVHKLLEAGGSIAGVFLLDSRLSVGTAIEELFLINECSEQTEWRGRFVFLPL